MASRSPPIDSSISDNQRMSNKEKCVMCSTAPEDVMVLSCTHCICLPCAALETRQERNGSHSIHCNLCLEPTEIDDQLYRELMELVAAAQTAHRPSDERTGRFDRDLERTCNWHQEEPITYVCKTCNDAFICPECLIHGCHVNHDATTIHKEGERIKGRLQQDLAKVNEKIDELEKLQVGRVASIEQRRRELEKLRNSARQQYESIRQAIAKEESTVLAKCSELIASHQAEEDSFRRDIAQQITLYQNQRIDLIDLLNPLLEAGLVGQSRALQKMAMVNLVASYKKFTRVCQMDRQNHIRVAEEKMKEDLEVIETLTKKIDKISINNFQKNNNNVETLPIFTKTKNSSNVNHKNFFKLL